jgi:hypothetical protein
MLASDLEGVTAHCAEGEVFRDEEGTALIGQQLLRKDSKAICSLADIADEANAFPLPRLGLSFARRQS